MRERIDHAWRVAGTGLSFLAFGLGGLFLGLCVLPPMLWLVRDPERRRRWARRIVQRSFAAHVELMRRLGVMTYEIRGRERLARDGLLVLANHPTLIDVVLLVSLLPNADCVVKSAVARNPFMRGPVRAAGYVSNDDGAGLVEDCIAAVRGAMDITPVRITCSPLTLGKGDKWYRVPPTRFHMVIDVQEDLPIVPFLNGTEGADPSAGGEALAARRLTEHLANYFAGDPSRAGT